VPAVAAEGSSFAAAPDLVSGRDDLPRAAGAGASMSRQERSCDPLDQDYNATSLFFILSLQAVNVRTP
jgi:hypothetical protein